jgi:uncharacterized membrane protein YdjX (TVP38/TMEM64 family)
MTDHGSAAATKHEEPAESSRGLLRTVLFVLILLSVIAALWLAIERGWIDPRGVVRWLESVSGLWWAPVAFVGLYIAFNVFALPGTPLTLTAGALWGWFVGGLWVIVGSVAGASVAYWLSKTGAPWIESLIRRRASGVYEKLRNEGFTTLLLMRLVPIFPYNVLNYASGLAGIRFKDYFLATLFGMIPGIFIYTYLADALRDGLLSPREAFTRVLIAGFLLVLLAVVGRLLAGRVRKRLAD